MRIPKEKKELISTINNYFSSEIYKILENEIKKAVLEEKLRYKIIHSFLEKSLNKKLSFDSLKKFIMINKRKWLKDDEKLCKNCKFYHNGYCMNKKIKKMNNSFKVDKDFSCILFTP